MSQNNGHDRTSLRLKTGLAEMLKGGVIMDVTNAEQALIAEKAGAVAVMALERVPAQIRAEGGVARMASPVCRRTLPLATPPICSLRWVRARSSPSFLNFAVLNRTSSTAL